MLLCFCQGPQKNLFVPAVLGDSRMAGKHISAIKEFTPTAPNSTQTPFNSHNTSEIIFACQAETCINDHGFEELNPNPK